MKILVAPEKYIKQNNDICIFLAGGIQKCKEWQDELIEFIEQYDKANPNILKNLILFNPRRKNFPIHDPNAANEQIKWEFEYLENMDIFSIYFDGPTESDQPICFYELGRNISQIMNKFPEDYKNRILVTYCKQFKRWQDIDIQTKLATNKKIIANDDGSVLKHGIRIIRAYLTLNNNL